MFDIFFLHFVKSNLINALSGKKRAQSNRKDSFARKITLMIDKILFLLSLNLPYADSMQNTKLKY